MRLDRSTTGGVVVEVPGPAYGAASSASCGSSLRKENAELSAWLLAAHEAGRVGGRWWIAAIMLCPGDSGELKSSG